MNPLRLRFTGPADRITEARSRLELMDQVVDVREIDRDSVFDHEDDSSSAGLAEQHVADATELEIFFVANEAEELIRLFLESLAEELNIAIERSPV